MTAAVIHEQGLPRPFAESRPLAIERVDLEGPGDGEVLVEIRAAGLCHSDLSAIKGLRRRALPAVIGHEAAGVVVETGTGVLDLAVGDHVVMIFVASCGHCRYCATGRPQLCRSSWKARAEGTLESGARRLSLRGRPLNHYSGLSSFAEYAVCSWRSLVRIPKDIAFEDATLFGCAVLTGVGAVLNATAIRDGDTVAVVGLGGVGLSAVLGCCTTGAARIVAIDVNDEKLELARRLGAHETYSAADPDCAAKVREATDGGLDHVFEMAGAATALGLAYDIGGRGSILVCAGLPPDDATFSYNPAALVGAERTIRGSYMGSAVAARDIPAYVEMFRTGRLPVDRLRSSEINFDELNAAFDRLDEGRSVRQILRCRG